jgi:hypothetical protein
MPFERNLTNGRRKLNRNKAKIKFGYGKIDQGYYDQNGPGKRPPG